MINNTIIKQLTTTKFLGVEINTEAGWKEHISIINQKISRAIEVIRCVRTKLSIKTCMLLYNSVILSQLTYCNMIWASTYKTTLLKTYSLQKRALKLWFGRKFQNTRNNYQTVERNSLSIFKQANRLSVFDLNKWQIAKFVYQALNKISPSCFHQMFSFTSSAHSHNTRSDAAHNLFIQQAKYNLRKFSISVRGPEIWNELPITCRLVSSIDTFYSKIKQYFITASS